MTVQRVVRVVLEHGDDTVTPANPYHLADDLASL